jgi:hypothetical protein
VTWTFASLEEAMAWLGLNFGALIAARRDLGDRYAGLRDRLVALMRDWNRGDGDAVRLPATYLLAVARTQA